MTIEKKQGIIENASITRNPHMMTGDLYFHERIGDYLHKYGISIMENSPWMRVGAVDGLYLELCFFMHKDQVAELNKKKEELWKFFGLAIANKAPSDITKFFSISDELMQDLIKLAHTKQLITSNNEGRR